MAHEPSWLKIDRKVWKCTPLSLDVESLSFDINVELRYSHSLSQ
ncbi:hypothetical protein GcM3_113033 [Golovinomyces cichoracearum]|uniref:Uncharacterized protein n=1 Tax=Golovinomyces cichoracearum TaxID=62708 RepID=A0A420I8G3_9PEZI|nr:hypothetical protein GcM3_113033 [Golovinomyces cichoracearum]